MKLEFSEPIFEKNGSDIKFNKNPSSGNRVVPCGWTDLTKLTVAFRNLANVLKNAFRHSALAYRILLKSGMVFGISDYKRKV